MEYPVITFAPDKSELVIDRNEVLRYLGYSKTVVNEEIVNSIEPVIDEAMKVISPRACYSRFALEMLDDNVIRLPYGDVTSRHLTINLKGCHGIFFFAATIGAPFDRLMARMRVSSMAKAAILQAIGATAVESLCDILCDKLAKEAEANGEKLRARYSPGFGDYGLDNQVGFFSTLTPQKYAGITLNESLIMSPEKSVTALIGIEKLM